MKPKSNPFLRSAALAASIVYSFGSAFATVYQWDGGASTGNWQTATNWNPDTGNADFNGTFANRLNVNGGQKLVYSSDEGDTIYTGDTVTGGGRGFVIGSLSSGTMEITGGTFSSLGSIGQDIIGNGNSSTGILTISGGDFIGTDAGTSLGIGTGSGRVSTLNVQSGSATIASLTMNSTLATINLSGTGVLAVNSISKVSGSTANINFDGGTLKARIDSTSFMTGLNTATINGGGVSIDSNGKNITIGQALLVGSGSGGLTKSGAGTLTLSGANTYIGDTAVSEGTLSVTNPLAGGSYTGAVSIASGALFSYNSSSSQTLSGTISGLGALTKSGSGILNLSDSSNSYSGATTITGGAIVRTAADSTTGDISVSNNATFVLAGGVTDGAGQSITLSGPGATSSGYFYSGSAVQRGALQGQNGANTWNGDIVLTTTGNTRIGVQDGASLTIGGNITESAAGASPTFRAGAVGDNITLNGVGSWTGDTVMFSAGGSIILGGNDRLPTDSRVVFTGSSTVFDLNGHNQQVLGLTSFNPTITNGGTTPSVLTLSPLAGTDIGFFGVIKDGSGAISVAKSGDGTITLGGNNSYTGTTTVSGGTLVIHSSGSLASGSAVTVESSATLDVRGAVNGTVTVDDGGTLTGNGGQFNASVIIDGIHAPGASPGLQTFTTGLSYGSTAVLNAEFSGDTLGIRGTNFDAIDVTGGSLTIDLSSIFILAATGIDYTNVLWDSARSFTVIDYSGAGSSSGVFSLDTSLAGSFASEGEWSLANTDSDIILSWAPVPEPTAAMLAMLGTFGVLLRRRRSA